MPPRVPTVEQVSAGGVVFRRRGATVEVALILVGPAAKRRWQLPKGIVDPGESPETTAVREVREETGLEAELVAPLAPIEYWYYGLQRGERVRFHKRVHFFLLAYRDGDVRDHDHEVVEARWLSLDEARTALAFENERRALSEAHDLIGP